MVEEKKKKVPNLTKGSMIGTILATSAVWVGLIAGGIYIKDFTSISIPSLNINNQKVQVIKVARDIKNGSIIKNTDLKIAIEPADKVVNHACNNPKDIIGKIAAKNFYPNEQILKEDVVAKGLEDLKPCTIAVTLGNLSDNTISPGDYVDVLLSYRKENQKADKKSDIVSPKLIVKSVVDSKGQAMKDSQTGTSTDTQIPAYITVLGTDQDILFIEDAKKKGSLDFYLYPDKNTKASEKTYIPSWEDQSPTLTAKTTVQK